MSTTLTGKIRVALCITELNIGGAELVLSELARRLDRTRFDPVVYSLNDKPDDLNKTCIPLLDKEGIETRFLGINSIATALAGLCRLRKMLSRQRPHILQGFLFHANFIGRLATVFNGIPSCFSGVRVAEWEKPFYMKLDRWTQRLVNKYVCVGPNVRDHCIMPGKIAVRKLAVIPNGVDPSGYEQAQPADLKRVEAVPGSKKILFLGRLHRQKGLDWFLETLPLWMPHLPDWELILVGRGPEKDALCAQIAQDEFSAFRDRIHFLGWRPDVPELLAASELLVLPSRWEGMPNVVLQAMAARKAVLVTEKLAGCDELLSDDGETPDLMDLQTFPSGEVDTFVSKLYYLAKKNSVRKELGVRNNQRVREKFTWQRMVDAYESLWLETLRERGFTEF